MATRLRRPPAGFIAAATAAAVLVSGVAGCDGASVPSESSGASFSAGRTDPAGTSDPPSGQAGPTDALATLAGLAIKGRAPKTGYDRDQFGAAWSDDVTVAGGHNGCDTRNDILRRDLVDLELKPGSHGCTVLAGTLHDPYTGTTVSFRRGPGSSSRVQVDHVVALSDAWQKGAQQWDAATRRDFANDPRNLQATIGSVNEQKGDGDAATWLPPNKAYRCTYVARIVEVKADYGLWVTQAEHDAIARILSHCTTSGDAPEPVPVPAETPPPATGASTYYPDCTAARAAGAAPLHAGSPGYRTGLDGDGDGVACE